MKIARVVLCHLIVALVAIVTVSFAMDAAARPHEQTLPFETWSEQIANAEARLSDPTLSDFTVDRWVAQLEALVVEARAAAASARQQASPIASQLEALGPAPEEGAVEAQSLSQERANLQQKVAGFEADARRAEAIAARAEQVLTRLRDWRRDAFTEQLFTRSDSPLSPSVLGAAVQQLADGLLRAREQHLGILARLSEEGLLATAAIAVAIALVIAAGLILVLRRVVITRLIAQVTPGSSELRKLLVAIALATARLIIPLSAIAVIELSFDRFTEFGFGDLTVLNAALRGAAVVIAVYALAFTYYSPSNPALRLADLDDTNSGRAAKWAVAIAIMWAVDELLVAFGALHSLGEQAMAVMNLAVMCLGATAFWRFIAVNRGRSETAPSAHQGEGAKAVAEAGEEDEDEAEERDRRAETEPVEVVISRVARVFALAATAFAPLAAIVGFYALSRYALSNIILSTALFGVWTLLQAAVRSGFDALAETVGEPRAEAGRPADFSLAPIVFGVFLALLALPVLALIWGAKEDDLYAAYRSFSDGFQIGDFHFSPVDVLSFAAVFVIGVIVTRTVQSILRGTILPKTKLDEGARASLVSGVGYIGFPVAALAAVGAAGLDLSNIAIVAGALSVGIGFGLQNVVNNFVSGVILLVERPVKVGDWIVVAGEHGYVRKINVRSTEIQTFDRTTLIVPNSELISSTVTNYTHNDLMGRLIAPIGVAYGTDTRKVERILIEIARANSSVKRFPAPQVVFMNFGDSSLDFELRVFLRDVNDVLRTRSAINFEIARRFEEEGIEIPFPQRDVNLRDIDRLVSAIRGESEQPSS